MNACTESGESSNDSSRLRADTVISSSTRSPANTCCAWAVSTARNIGPTIMPNAALNAVERNAWDKN
ncbi:MAG TPA: hypothetical protein VGE08_02175 [Steroidobacter sp.]|uniref:hypothetical protein n=1 Tax=Steroidobacter sp. TaxID=1978227 RepID=UPI002EDB8D4E